MTFNIDGSSTVGYPVSLSYDSFSKYDDPTAIPSTTPWFSGGASGSFGWSPTVADVGIWVAEFSVCDSAGRCDYGSVEIQIVNSISSILPFVVTSSESYYWWTTGLFAADCNGDLDPEIVAISDGGLDETSLRTMDFQAPAEITTLFAGAHTLTNRGGNVGFVDSDNYIDLVTGHFNSGDRVAVYSGNGDGSFTKTFETPANLPHRSLSAQLAEFTSDQYIDYLAVTKEAAVLYAGDSLGQFSLLTTIPLGSDSGVTVNIGDFNSDGYQDIALGTITDFRIYLGDGQGNFALNSSYAQTYLSADLEVTNQGSDFNNDNIIDLCIATPSLGGARSEIMMYIGDGLGGFSQIQLRDAKGQILANVIGDFNLDGNLDIALANGSDSYIAILIGDGAGNFVDEVRYHIPGEFPHMMVAADFDLDGDLDLAVDGIRGLEQESKLHVFVNQLNPTNFTSTNFVISGMDNTDIQLTSASGKVFNSVRKGVSSGSYHQRNLNNNDIIDDVLYTNLVEDGSYTVSVRPKAHLSPGDPFCSEYTLDGKRYRLAYNIPMIPQGYDFRVFPSGSSEVLPVPGAFTYSNPPTFLWSGSGNFQFQLSDDIDFNNIVIDQTVSGTNLTLASSLPVADTFMFFWRVKSVGETEYDAFYPVNIMAGGPTVCGDADGSGSVDVADLTYIVAYLFLGGPTPPDFAQADMDGSGAIDVI